MSTIINGTSDAITFPDATIQNTSAVVSGKVPYSVLPAGSVLQVVSFSTASTTTTTSASYVATALTASITPKFSTSKILVQVTGPMDSATTNSQANATIYRNGANIGPSAGFTNIFSNSGRIIGAVPINYLDSPATTSSTTYALYINGSAGATIVFPQGANLATITLTEIAG